MSRPMTVAVFGTVGLVAVIFVAGFFSGKGEAPEPGASAAANSETLSRCGEASGLRGTLHRRDGSPANEKSFNEPKEGALLGMVNSPAYKRSADVSIKVADCVKAEDELESKLEAVKGEILDMVMEGTEGSRVCSISVLIPANQFRSFVGDLRKMGKVQAERVIASKLKPGAVAGDSKEEPDARELSMVAVRMADEKIAKDVLESRGLLAASFDKSASHFMNGLAVGVEVVGYVLPYLIALAAVLLPLLLVVRLKKMRGVEAVR